MSWFSSLPLSPQHQHGAAVQPGAVRQGEAVPTGPAGQGHAGYQEAARHGEALLPPQLSAGGESPSRAVRHQRLVSMVYLYRARCP